MKALALALLLQPMTALAEVLTPALAVDPQRITAPWWVFAGIVLVVGIGMAYLFHKKAPVAAASFEASALAAARKEIDELTALLHKQADTHKELVAAHADVLAKVPTPAPSAPAPTPW